MTRDLLDPTVLSDPGGLTFLSGDNVGLLPSAVSRVVGRLAGPARCRRGGVPFVAFSRARQGLVGCRGSIEAPEGRPFLTDLEAFGARSALAGFGRELAGILARPGRFAEVPGVEPGQGAGADVDVLVSGLLGGGLEAVAPRSGKEWIHGR